MGISFTEPSGYPNVAGYRLVDMFSRVQTAAKREEVLKSFSETGSKLCLIIATTAFGMGIDCPDIRRIFHWGLPSTLEEYVQESGRSGRDGQLSTAVLYPGKGKHASTKVKAYVSNSSTCRCTQKVKLKQVVVTAVMYVVNHVVVFSVSHNG